MRGAFRAHKKISDAKYRVKTKRANADKEVRGADPDFSTRGGRAAAMDPSTGAAVGRSGNAAAGVTGTARAQPWQGGRLLPRPPNGGQLRVTGGAPIKSA